MLLSELSHAATIVEAMPCHSTMALGKNSAMQGEPNSPIVFNPKRCTKDRVTKNKVVEKYLGTVARCHDGDKVAKRDKVAKTKLRRRREREQNRARVLIFLNVCSTSVFNTKLMLTKWCTIYFLEETDINLSYVNIDFLKTDVNELTLKSVFEKLMLTWLR